ncbi:ubiquitin-related domain-containing protein, partial [Polychytrium aggregatum]|uniref:ubiquitin-related domain-containing protein n=1 Tax=Polychytrium aggregatum TaxID=110093 RepID=UPI0022FDC68A
VGTLTGKTFTIPVISTDTIGEVKCRIYEEEGIPVGAQVLVWKEKELSDDNAMVCDYGLCSGATLQLTLQMSGG